MNKKTAALLKKLNVPQETITALTDEETKDNDGPEDVDIAEVVGGVRSGIREALKNDTSFVESIESRAEAKAKSTLENKLRHLVGMSSTDFEAMEKKGRMEKMIGLVQEKIANASEGDAKELQQKLDTVIEEKNTLSDELKKVREEEIPNIKNEVETEKRNLKIGSLGKKLQSAMATREEKRMQVVIDPDAAHTMVMNEITGEYDLRLSEDGKTVEVYQKGKDMKAYTSDDKPVKFDSLYESKHADMKLVKESNGGDGGDGNDGARGGGRGGRKPGSSEHKYKTPGMKKAQEAMKAAEKKGG